MTEAQTSQTGLVQRALATVERVGNKLPDPAILFVYLLIAVWVLSWLLSYLAFEAIDPRTETAVVVKNMLSGPALTGLMSTMVTNFSHFIRSV